MSRRRVRVVVAGRVQGVWFRDSTRREAEACGAVGWVRNLTDGRVEALFDGAPAAIDTLLHWCQAGPPLARVSSVEVHEEALDDALDRFTVRPTAAPSDR